MATANVHQPEVTRYELSSSLVSTFQVARVHSLHQKPVSCLDFSTDGQTLVSSSTDDTLLVYNCVTGLHEGTIPVRKYGAGVFRFIQDRAPPTIVTASTTVRTSSDHKLRAMDISRPTYVRYYDGHEAQVVSISASPVSAQFISSSQDAFVRVWDCRNKTAVGRVRALGTPVVAYDPKGLIFGLAYNAPNYKTMVKLYDARQFDDGPFLEFPLPNPSDSVPTCLKFSSDGEYFILVNADANAAVSVHDAYKGERFRQFTGHRNVSGVPLEASFSPDAAFVASGSDDGSVFLWDLQSSDLLAERKEIHALPSACVLWNPVYAMMTSACQNVAFWLPDDVDEGSTTDPTLP